MIAISCLALLATASCTDGSVGGQPVDTSTAPSTTTSPVTRSAIERSHLPVDKIDVTDLWVRRRGHRVWVTDGRPPRPLGAAAHSGCARVATELDLCSTHGGPRSAVRWTTSGGREWTRVAAPVRGVLPWFVPSLVPDTLAIALGGDGATVFPLLRVLRSTDLGATWSTHDVPEVGGERRATTGHVLLSDGRLLVVVGSGRHPGFLVSAPDDLGELRPVEPRFFPPVTEAEGNGPCCVSLDASTDPDPVLWTTTWDRRVYASTDDGRTFHELTVDGGAGRPPG